MWSDPVSWGAAWCVVSFIAGTITSLLADALVDDSERYDRLFGETYAQYEWPSDPLTWL